MSSRLTTAFVTAVCGGFLAIACSGTIAEDVYVGDLTPTGPLASPDAGTSVEVEAGLIEYCPTYDCRDPFTTCPSSDFPCDVNIKSDPNNCGGCGIVCPRFGGSVFQCVEGKCALSCWKGWGDCNGLLDDACETQFGTNENCNGCGDVCSDPAKPCIAGKCGCGGDQVLCPDGCVDTKRDSQNCGACGVQCPPIDDAKPPPHMNYGCIDGECGRLKCQNKWDNCNGDVEDGCETSLMLPTSCGGCNIVCGPDQRCIPDARLDPVCACPPGKTLCGSECFDLRTDLYNCGGCGISCFDSSLMNGGATNGVLTCSYGACGFACREGFGDCNGDSADGCEVNLNSDPNNCGACGNSCDVALGQPCILGQCAVEPCAPGKEETR